MVCRGESTTILPMSLYYFKPIPSGPKTKQSLVGATKLAPSKSF